MKLEHKVIGVSIAFGISFWFIDAVLDYVLFYDETFLDLVIRQISPVEIYIRLIVLVLFTVFGFVMAGVLASRRRLEEELQRLAISDSLTGIFNRRHFFEIAKREMERSKRYKHHLTIILFDIDRFKRVNDTYGHQTGDQVLQILSALWRENLREIDVIARYGGEEFIVLLPETNLESAQQVAERLRVKVAEQNVPVGKDYISFTISLGVASGDHGEHALDKVLSCADQALYTAKERGRNQTVIWNGSMQG
jgi:diguanylate cyclase (GGDEF)-like protein